MTNNEQKQGELKACPFCGGMPKIFQDKVYYCQLHGDPSQSMVVKCENANCFAKPAIRGGDCYNHTKSEGFEAGKKRAKEEAIARWNTRAESTRITELEKSNQELVEELSIVMALSSEYKHTLTYKRAAATLARHANLKKEG